MDDFIDGLERWFAAGDVAQAEAQVAACEASDPARHALGRAALAAHAKDAAGTPAYADRASALAPDQPMVLQYLAIAALLRGDRAAAEAHAEAAVAHGGGV